MNKTQVRRAAMSKLKSDHDIMKLVTGAMLIHIILMLSEHTICPKH